jgi:16S rRNA (guanine527-N7)-methyltransferase
VAKPDLATRINRRAARAGIALAPDLAVALAAYLSLLARWNRRINLTGLTIDPPGDEALDRLVIEPLAASNYFLPTDRFLLDLGSGGGSPAIPLWLARPSLRLMMVEAKARKCAFLREAVREFGMTNVAVEHRRYEELLTRPDVNSQADVVTLRAVRVGDRLLRAAQAFMRIGGRLWLFQSMGGRDSLETAVGSGLTLQKIEPLLASIGSELAIYECR